VCLKACGVSKLEEIYMHPFYSYEYSTKVCWNRYKSCTDATQTHLYSELTSCSWLRLGHAELGRVIVLFTPAKHREGRTI